MAEFEREIIRHRVSEGLQAARARKKMLGRPKGLNKVALPAGALYKENTLNVVNIYEQLGISIPTLYRYLKHQKYYLEG